MLEFKQTEIINELILVGQISKSAWLVCKTINIPGGMKVSNHAGSLGRSWYHETILWRHIYRRSHAAQSTIVYPASFIQD
jgi:hypothetical protein